MMNYKYVVESFFDDAKVTVETNDPEVAVVEIFQRDMDGVHAHCIDGLTGEVLALVNHPDQFTTPEFSLMTFNVLMAHLWESVPHEETNPMAEALLALLSACGKGGVPVLFSDGESLPS